MSTPRVLRRAAAVVGGVTIGLLGIALPAHADLSVAEYRSRVARASDLAQEARTAYEREAGTLLRRAREQFPVQATVQVADDVSVVVENESAAGRLDEAIAAGTPDARGRAIERFRRRAEALVAALEVGPAERGPGEAKVLAGILSKPPFKPTRFEQWERDLQERWRNWWRDFYRRLLGNRSPRTMEWIAGVLYWAVLALLVALLVYLIITYVPGLRLPSRTRASAADAADTIDLPERARARLAAAEAAAAQGQYLEALRQTYAAMLLMLDEAHLLTYDPARTNREVLRALRAAEHAPLRDVLAPVTRVVEEKFYGGRLTTAADYEGSRDACMRLRGLLPP